MSSTVGYLVKWSPSAGGKGIVCCRDWEEAVMAGLEFMKAGAEKIEIERITFTTTLDPDTRQP